MPSPIAYIFFTIMLIPGLIAILPLLLATIGSIAVVLLFRLIFRF